MKQMNKEYIKDLKKGIEAHSYNAEPQLIDNTFVQDFRIAENFGTSAIIDTFNIVVREWQNDVRYYAAFTYALNVLCWYHYKQGERELSELYANLYHKSQELSETFDWNELEQRYFFCVTD